MLQHIENLSKTPRYAATSMNFSGKFIGMAEKLGDLDRFNFSLYVFLLALFLNNDRMCIIDSSAENCNDVSAHAVTR